MGFSFGGLFGGGGGSDVAMPEAPEYYLSDYYTQSQEKLAGQYTDILQGELPEYYQPIGEYGGEDFNKIMEGITSRVTTDVSRAVNEDITRRGVSRGGLGTAATAMAVAEKTGDIQAALSYDDYSRALAARGDLLGLGLQGIEGVRGAGLSESQLRNMFNLDVFGTEMTRYKTASSEASESGDFMAQLFDVGAQFAMNSMSSSSTSSTVPSSAPIT